MERHGSPCSEGVAADVGAFIAKQSVQSVGFGPLLEGGVDVVGRDGLPSHVQWVGVRVDGHGLVVVSGRHDVVDSPGQRFDGAVDGLGAFNVDVLSFGSILLVGDANSGIDCLVKLFQGRGIGDLVTVGVSEGDVVDCKGHSVLINGSGFGVLTDPEQKVESDVAEVGRRLLFSLGGGSGWGSESFVQQVLGECDGHGELWECGWVLTFVAVKLGLQACPAFRTYPVVLGGVGPVVHLEGLGDGAQRRRN